MIIEIVLLINARIPRSTFRDTTNLPYDEYATARENLQFLLSFPGYF